MPKDQQKNFEIRPAPSNLYDMQKLAGLYLGTFYNMWKNPLPLTHHCYCVHFEMDALMLMQICVLYVYWVLSCLRSIYSKFPFLLFQIHFINKFHDPRPQIFSITIIIVPAFRFVVCCFDILFHCMCRNTHLGQQTSQVPKGSFKSLRVPQEVRLEMEYSKRQRLREWQKSGKWESRDSIREDVDYN